MLGIENKKLPNKQYNEFNPGIFLNLSPGGICEEDSNDADTSIDEEATGTLNSSMHKEMLLNRDTIKQMQDNPQLGESVGSLPASALNALRKSIKPKSSTEELFKY